MKKILLLLLVLILTAACGCRRTISDFNIPPALTVIYDGQKYDASCGTYTWSGPGGDIEADSPMMLQRLSSLTTIHLKDSKQIRLSFELEPDEIHLYCWTDREVRIAEQNPNGAYALYRDIQERELEVKDWMVLLPADGRCVYEVQAVWRSDGHYGGVADFGFCTTYSGSGGGKNPVDFPPSQVYYRPCE